jgi:4-amino-4-deoxy-L-arabinose transferase-like glycosyltransferase
MTNLENAPERPDLHRPATFPRHEMAVDLCVIAALWVVSVILVNPIGDFPLNDDWAMGKTVKHLVEAGTYLPSGWTGMPLITQTLWGALFCIPAGFSFTALRFSTLTVSFVGIAATYYLVRQLGRSRSTARLCAVTLGWNPIYFALSNTFMTDVPFTTFVILASLFYVRYLQLESVRDLMLGTLFVLAGVLCRQLGICVAFGFGAALLLKYRFQRRWIVRALFPAALSIIVLAAFQYYLIATGRLPALYNEKSNKLISVIGHPFKLSLNIVYYGWSILMYLGWFILPVLIPAVLPQLVTGRYPRPSRLTRGLLLFFAVASVVRFVVVPSLMPVHNNVIIPQGIGPPTLKDTQNLHLPHLPPLPVTFWVFVTAISLLGAALLIVNATDVLSRIFSRSRLDSPKDGRIIAVFFALCAFSYLLPLLMSGFFDRYLIPVLPLLTGIASLSLPASGFTLSKAAWNAATAFVGILAIFAIASTRDYLEWNRTRWHAAQQLLETHHVDPQKVDGGFEFNGWYSYETFGKTNWWLINDSYALAFGEIDGYEPLNHYPYLNWMPPRTGSIFVLHRKSDSSLGNTNAASAPKVPQEPVRVPK